MIDNSISELVTEIIEKHLSEIEFTDEESKLLSSQHLLHILSGSSHEQIRQRAEYLGTMELLYAVAFPSDEALEIWKNKDG